MNKADLAEYRHLHEDAFRILGRIPSYEKQRCIDSMSVYLAKNRPVEELKAFKQRPFALQWKVCAVRIIHNQLPFKGYNAELAVGI